MHIGTLLALLAAVCSGTAAVLQALAARRAPVVSALTLTWWGRLLRDWRYLLALALIGSGFVLAAAALRQAPLFLVQSVRSASLMVTAVLAVVLMSVKLRLADVIAVAVAAAGIVLLAFSVQPGPAVTTTAGQRAWLILGFAVLALLAVLASRLPVTEPTGVLLGVVAGCLFALVALASRLLVSFAPHRMVTDPAAWALGLSALLGLLLVPMAMQRASVVAVTTAAVATETVCGAGLGLLIAGDQAMAGRGWLAAAGVGLTLIASVVLARFGDVAAAEEELVEAALSEDEPRAG